MFERIFFTNMLRFRRELGITNKQLAAKSGISESFLSELGRGGAGRIDANPSIQTMEKIAAALNVSLIEMLIPSDPIFLKELDIPSDLDLPTPPPGYERVVAVLPSHRAFVVRKWDAEARAKLKSR